MNSFNDMGIVLYRHHLVYGWRHGWGRWLPEKVKYFIVHCFNWVSCRLFGHDTFDGTCTACCEKNLERDN